MTEPQIIFAKLAGLKRLLDSWEPRPGYVYDPSKVLEYFHQYHRLSDTLRSAYPDLFGDLPQRDIPTPVEGSDFDGRGYIKGDQLTTLDRDLEYVFEVWANAKLPAPAHPKEFRVFVSHGRSTAWREVQDYIERDLEVETIELAQEPNRGRTVIQKLLEESDRCTFAVIVMTGDDEVADSKPRARENVIHEIGFFQGKYGAQNVCLLYEEGTNIPSNIHGVAYIPFPTGLVSASFGALQREIKAARRS